MHLSRLAALPAIPLLLVALTADPAAASASSDAILAECVAGGTVADGHTVAELRDAAGDLPADADEYTDCRAQIEAAQRRAARAAHGTTAGTGASPSYAPPAVSASPLEQPVARSTPDVAAADAVLATLRAARPDEEAVASAQPIGDDDPVGTQLGSVAAAALVGASLLVLGRPAMLRRRRDEEE